MAVTNNAAQQAQLGRSNDAAPAEVFLSKHLQGWRRARHGAICGLQWAGTILLPRLRLCAAYRRWVPVASAAVSCCSLTVLLTLVIGAWLP